MEIKTKYNIGDKVITEDGEKITITEISVDVTAEDSTIHYKDDSDDLCTWHQAWEIKGEQ